MYSYVFACICTVMCLHVYVQLCVCMYMYSYVFTCICTVMCLHVYVQLCVCMYMYSYVFTCICTVMCLHVYVQLCVYMYMYSYCIAGNKHKATLSIATLPLSQTYNLVVDWIQQDIEHQWSIRSRKSSHKMKYALLTNKQSRLQDYG